jgi:hypothetical protein
MGRQYPGVLEKRCPAILESPDYLRAKGAKVNGKQCGKCGVDLDPKAPLWIGLMWFKEFRIGKGKGSYTASMDGVPMCEPCGKPQKYLAREAREPIPCCGCDRPIHVPWSSQMDNITCCLECWHERRRVDKPPPKPCEFCGVEFQPAMAGVRFCSKSCNGKFAYRERKPEVVPRTCRGCGKSYLSPYKNKQFCGRSCGLAYHHRLASPGPVGPQKCERCGGQYQPAKRGSKYCSKKCKRWGEKPPVVHAARGCAYCGSTFVPRRSDAIYCGKSCGVGACKARQRK